MKSALKKIIQTANADKRFTTFPTMNKHEKHIDNRAKISESSNKFLHSLVKSLKINGSTSHENFYENATIQNEKPQRAEK